MDGPIGLLEDMARIIVDMVVITVCMARIVVDMVEVIAVVIVEDTAENKI
jgi:hypothetical protein